MMEGAVRQSAAGAGLSPCHFGGESSWCQLTSMLAPGGGVHENGHAECDDDDESSPSLASWAGLCAVVRSRSGGVVLMVIANGFLGRCL